MFRAHVQQREGAQPNGVRSITYARTEMGAVGLTDSRVAILPAPAAEWPAALNAKTARHIRHFGHS
jgi:hypothetical protein